MGRHGQGSWDTVTRGGRKYVRFRITIEGRTVERVSVSKARVEKEATKLRQRARQRLIGDDEDITLETWALDRWLEAKKIELGAAGAKTIRNYEVVLNKHVVPALGRLKVRDVRAQHRRAFQRALLAKKLKPSTVNIIDGVLKACLQAAADDELPVVVSAISAVKPVKAAPEAEHSLSLADVQAILSTARPPWAPMWTLYAYTGARDSEVRALRWQDWDQDAGLLRIRRQLPQQPGDPPKWQEWIKGRKVERVVPVVGPLAQALKEHRARQNEARLATLGWCDYGLVFPDEIGRALPAHRVNRQFEAACTAAKVGTWKGLGVHALRHAANNLLRECGVDAPLRAQILGHTRAVNERTYTAESLTMATQALRKMAETLAV